MPHESYASPSVDNYSPPSETYGVPSDTYGSPYAPPSGRENHGSHSAYSPTKYSNEPHENYEPQSVDTYGSPSAPSLDSYSPPASKVETQKYYS